MTRAAAIDNIQRFFANTTNAEISVEALFLAVGRDLSNEKANKQWLANKLSEMKDYRLLKKHYTHGKLTSVSLTDTGKDAIGPFPSDNSDDQPTVLSTPTYDTEALLESVNRDVEKLKQKLPSFEVTFDIKPKGMPVNR